MIVAEALGYHYEREWIFRDVTFQVARGEFAALIGPNGAGKSTLLKLLGGIYLPSAGKVRIDDMTVGAAQRAGRIGYVPQNYSQNTAAFPASVAEVTALGLVTSRLSQAERERRVMTVLAEVGMEAYSRHRIGDLSGGQQQRVMIAQALVKQPSVLLLDEPTSGIDYTTGSELMKLLRFHNQRDNITVVMVSHDLERALPCADRVLCLNRELCYDGRPEGFYQSHEYGRHLFYGKRGTP